jgi:hypothetical protein
MLTENLIRSGKTGEEEERSDKLHDSDIYTDKGIGTNKDLLEKIDAIKR